MSRSIRGEKGPGHEYWGRRYPKLREPGPETKRLTHKHERREGKREASRQQD